MTIVIGVCSKDDIYRCINSFGTFLPHVMIWVVFEDQD